LRVKELEKSEKSKIFDDDFNLKDVSNTIDKFNDFLIE